MSINQVLVTTTFLLFTQHVIAQRAGADTSYVSAATAKLQQRYFEERKSESLLFIGSDYAEYESLAGEHPFFLSDDWILGDIRYNGNLYRHVPLQLDVYSQKLLTEHPASGKKIELIKEHVLEFILNNHRFIYINEHQTQNKIPQGYYEVLVDGGVKLLARHTKAFQESTVTGKLEVRVEENTKYFLERDDMFFPVKNKSTTLSALADKKSALSQEVKRRRLNFSRDKQQAMIEIIKVYNSLPQP